MQRITTLNNSRENPTECWLANVISVNLFTQPIVDAAIGPSGPRPSWTGFSLPAQSERLDVADRNPFLLVREVVRRRDEG